MRKKHINLFEAREISKKFCEDFKIKYCEVYFVDKIDGCWGVYINLHPPHTLLTDDKNPCMIGYLMHELTHHLDWCKYERIFLDHTGSYQKAKKEVISWCRNNINSNANWELALKAIPDEKDMVKFRL